MCSNYEALRKWEHYEKYFNAARPSMQGKLDMWPRYEGVFVRKPPEGTFIAWQNNQQPKSKKAAKN